MFSRHLWVPGSARVPGLCQPAPGGPPGTRHCPGPERPGFTAYRSGLFAVSAFWPEGFAVQPRELKKLLPQRLVILAPPVTPLLDLFRGQRLLGQPGVIRVLGPDLHIHIAENAPIVTDGALRDPKVPVRQSYDKLR